MFIHLNIKTFTFKCPDIQISRHSNVLTIKYKDIQMSQVCQSDVISFVSIFLWWSSMLIFSVDLLCWFEVSIKNIIHNKWPNFNNLWLLKVNLGWGSFEIKKCCEIVKSAEIERTIYSESKSKKFLSLNLLEKSELDINRHCTLGYHSTKGYQCLEGNHCTMGNHQTKMLS